MPERVICFAAHPDDESLGCGGALRKHVLAGDAVMVVTLADGVASRGIPGTDIGRRREFHAAMKVLGVTQFAFGSYPDNQFDSVPLLMIVKDMEQAIDIFNPSLVYTHHSGDLNVDHRVTHEAVRVACRPQPGSQIKRVLYFEVPCSTGWGDGFEPTWFEDITNTLSTKIEAVSCYVSELRPYPHPRSRIGVSQQAGWRGSRVGKYAVEAFMVGRVTC